MGVFLPGLTSNLWKPAEGSELIGTRAPELDNLTWLNCKPVTLAQLRGKVVLIRFWLIDCPYCQRTAPALNYLLDKYQKDGLVIIGIHHPKSKEAEDPELVKKGASELKFKFPIAMDNEWTNVNAFWLSKRKRSYTSASFLIDKRGSIRWVHPGGDIIKDGNTSDKESAFASLESEIKMLLAEK
jgi:peroxiredoxin